MGLGDLIAGRLHLRGEPLRHRLIDERRLMEQHVTDARPSETPQDLRQSARLAQG